MLSSGSARRTILRKKLNNMFVPKRELGYNFIQPRSASNELNGIVEGSTLLINNSIKSVEETFSDGTNITHVKLDSSVSSGSLSGSYFTNFKPKGFYPSEKVATRDGKNTNKGLIIGDYKVKKARKGEPMRRDSFIKVPKKTGNKKGAL